MYIKKQESEAIERLKAISKEYSRQAVFRNNNQVKYPVMTYKDMTFKKDKTLGGCSIVKEFAGRMWYEYLEGLTEQEREALLLPVYAPVQHFTQIQVPEGRAEYFSRGMESNIDHAAEAQVLVFDGEKCLGLAEINDRKRLIPKRVLNL